MAAGAFLPPRFAVTPFQDVEGLQGRQILPLGVGPLENARPTPLEVSARPIRGVGPSSFIGPTPKYGKTYPNFMYLWNMYNFLSKIIDSI